MRSFRRAFAALGLGCWLGLSACVHGGPAAPAIPPKAKGSPSEASPYLAGVAESAARLGGSPLEVLGSSAGIPGDSLSAFVSIPERRCAVLAARGAAPVEDLDLYLFGDDGDELDSTDEVDEPATLVHCAQDRAVRILVVARVAGGHGPYALGLVDAPAEREAVLRAEFLPARDSAAPPSDLPGLDEALSQHRDLLGGSWRDLRRVLVPVDHRLPTQLDFGVDEGSCVSALALPGDGALDLDVEAVDERGRIFGRAEAHGQERALLVCAGADPGRVTLRLRPHAGRGTVIVALSQTTHPGAIGDLHPEFPRHDLSPANGPLSAPVAGAVRLALSVDGMVMSGLPLAGCQRLELTPHFPLLGYHIAAYDSEGQLLGEHEGTGPKALYLCPPRSHGAHGKLQARATSRGGPLDVRSLPENAPAAPVLERSPLAASRLLGLAADLGFLRRLSDIGQVSEHELGPERLVRIPLLIPAERCVTVLVATERSGPGLEIGLVDSSTARYVDHARGARVAWVRSCAARGQTEDLVVELRAKHGETRALVATRQEVLTPRSAVLLR